MNQQAKHHPGLPETDLLQHPLGRVVKVASSPWTAWTATHDAPPPHAHPGEASGGDEEARLDGGLPGQPGRAEATMTVRATFVAKAVTDADGR
ncbi:hypothetical protein [Streptomyces vinaceus]|uniref:hypothetical protein n=1 Tax=Streptomyces vinaceus TaxID=1960 RepID=UPI0035DB2D56